LSLRLHGEDAAKFSECMHSSRRPAGADQVQMRRSPGGDVALIHAAGGSSSGRCTFRRHHGEVGNTTTQRTEL